VGVLSYEKGSFAFFDGTDSEFRKVLKSADSIAGYTLGNIGADSVTLSKGDSQLELKVGSQLRREEQGEWALSTQSQTYASSPANGSGSKPETAPSVSVQSEPTGADAEILKRLMQRREQE